MEQDRVEHVVELMRERPRQFANVGQPGLCRGPRLLPFAFEVNGQEPAPGPQRGVRAAFAVGSNFSCKRQGKKRGATVLIVDLFGDEGMPCDRCCMGKVEGLARACCGPGLACKL